MRSLLRPSGLEELKSIEALVSCRSCPGSLGDGTSVGAWRVNWTCLPLGANSQSWTMYVAHRLRNILLKLDSRLIRYSGLVMVAVL